MVTIPRRAADGAVAQERRANSPRHRACRVGRGASGGCKQLAILGDQQKDQTIDEAKQLTEEIAAAADRRCASRSRRSGIVGCERNPLPRTEQRRLDAVAETIARGSALLACRPRASVRGRNRSAGAPATSEAARVDEQPQRGKIGEVLAFKDLPKVGFDIGRAGEARVVAQQPQLVAIAAKTPEGGLPALSQSCTRGGGRRRRPSVGSSAC